MTLQVVKEADFKTQKMQWDLHQHRLDPGGEIREGFTKEWYLNNALYVCMCVHVCESVHVCVYACMCVCICMHVGMHMCVMCMCMHVCACICM